MEVYIIINKYWLEPIKDLSMARTKYFVTRKETKQYMQRNALSEKDNKIIKIEKLR